eukprot:4148956-Pleurochrysis_carterae.AAC.1
MERSEGLGESGEVRGMGRTARRGAFARWKGEGVFTKLNIAGVAWLPCCMVAVLHGCRVAWLPCCMVAVLH